MSYKEYQFVDISDSPVYTKLVNLGEKRSCRLTGRLLGFASGDVKMRYQVDPPSGDSEYEFHIVPSLYDLWKISDSAGLVFVSHADKTVRLIEVFDELGSKENMEDLEDVRKIIVDFIESAL